jgi:oxalate decarboxylase/phosphoglucose isomerase-like protein (cupin superfamily)
MATQSYPYETRLDVFYKPLEVVDAKALADDCQYKWYNQTLCQVNDSVVRLGVIEGEYHWHKHDNDDEFFYVVEGELVAEPQCVSMRTTNWWATCLLRSTAAKLHARFR